MSESLLGVSVAATRQNAGRSAYGLALPPSRLPGGVNCPAPTTCADVIAASFSASFARLSHVAPHAGGADRDASTQTAPVITRMLIVRPPRGGMLMTKRAAPKGCPL